MHQLEPLSWDSNPSIATFEEKPGIVSALNSPLEHEDATWARREHARSNIALRSTFRLIAAFHQGLDQKLSTTHLAVTANAVLELARLQFMLDSLRPRRSMDLVCNADQCIDDLETLVTTLVSGEVARPLELAHAMDTLICLLLLIDAESSHATHVLQ